METVDGRPTGVRVGIEGTPQILPLMHSDRHRIRKILASLLGNAYKFTSRGEVMASVNVHGDRVVYRVRDTGIGIPREAQEFVFEEFRQVDGSETRHYGGSGLGLTLARQLARVLGGDLTMESVPGEGSTFTVELPLETLPAASLRAPSSA
jgi:signal transduction histidine kinase